MKFIFNIICSFCHLFRWHRWKVWEVLNFFENEINSKIMRETPPSKHGNRKRKWTSNSGNRKGKWTSKVGNRKRKWTSKVGNRKNFIFSRKKERNSLLDNWNFAKMVRMLVRVMARVYRQVSISQWSIAWLNNLYWTVFILCCLIERYFIIFDLLQISHFIKQNNGERASFWQENPDWSILVSKSMAYQIYW